MSPDVFVGISDLISNTAFPIAAFLLLFWFIKDEQKANREELAKMSEVISNNTLVISKLLEHFHMEVK